MEQTDKKISTVKEILSIILICLLGITAVTFCVLYIELFSDGFFYNYSNIITAVSVCIISVLTVLTIVFYKESKGLIYKIFFIATITISIVLLMLYFLKSSGFLDKIDSVEDLREYVASFNNIGPIIFIIIQFLQVVILPIPAVITVGAGVLLFGPLKSAIYSCIGIISGSIVAYFIGKIFGYKAAKWLVGKENLDKWLKKIKGKDKIVLTFMYIFPFFPDDILCFVAGITTISPLFFIIMIITTRVISVFTSCYSMNNSLIPYNTWWGIILWILFFIITILLTIFIYKNGNKIEKLFKKKKHKKS